MSPRTRNNEKVTMYPPRPVSDDAEHERDIAEANDNEDITYPEGGLRAWLVVLGSFCGM